MIWQAQIGALVKTAPGILAHANLREHVISDVSRVFAVWAELGGLAQ
jgi:hypothetical protein